MTAITHERSFEIARDLAAAAALIDELKRIHPPPLLDVGTHFAEKLHDIAEELAGDRVAEIYGPFKVPA